MRIALFSRYVATAVGLIALPNKASAVPQNIWCLAVDGRERVAVGPFVVDSASLGQAQDEFIAWAKRLPNMRNVDAFCQVAPTLEQATAIVNEQKKYGKYVDDWYPSAVKAAPLESSIRAISLDFEPGDGSSFLHARRGYRRASINLKYRFLLCANEIQMAYALDRRSLGHSQEYVDKFVGLNPNMIVPASEPPVPMTVPLAVKVVLASPGTPYVATIRDQTAGEALGMGCFSGQTMRVGLVAKLIGASATRPQIKAYLDLLRADDITPGASLGFPLLNPDVPAPAAPAPRAPVRRRAK